MQTHAAVGAVGAKCAEHGRGVQAAILALTVVAVHAVVVASHPGRRRLQRRRRDRWGAVDADATIGAVGAKCADV